MSLPNTTWTFKHESLLHAAASTILFVSIMAPSWWTWKSELLIQPMNLIWMCMDWLCYDWLFGQYFFSSLSSLSSYASLRTMSIPGGPVCIHPWSPVLFACALSSGCPYPCSPSALPILSGVGSHFWSRCRSHCLVLIHVDSLISPRRFSRIALCSIWLTTVLHCSIVFHDDTSHSTYTSLPLY